MIQNCRFLALTVSICLSSACAAAPPRLVVVISVDQLCQDYLTRFEHNFAEDGFFRRVDQNGSAFTNCHHRHAFTFTAPGHSVMLTGTYPHATAIIGNGWFKPSIGRDFYCVEDPDVNIVGLPREEAESSNVKKISPRNLQAETVGDVLQAATDGKAKVIGLSLKDRAGVLMAGRKADAAYWFVNRRWVTSDYYMDELPKYLHNFNESRLSERHAGREWTYFQSIDRYTFYRPDEYEFEEDGYGLGRAFPHKLASADSPDYDKQLPVSPFGSEATFDIARQVIEYEELGADDVPDMLCLGLSSNDYCGHAYGPFSVEVEDITLRTDRMLGDLCKYLDAKVGKDQWLMVVTADHGVAPLPEFLTELGIERKRNPLGDKNLDQLHNLMEAAVREALGAPPKGKHFVLEAEVSQVYLSRDPAVLPKHQRAKAVSAVKSALLDNPAIYAAVSLDDVLAAKDTADPLMRKLFLTAHAERSGDVLFVLRPYYIQSRAAATHGSPWHYDTHVPLLMLGSCVARGNFPQPTSPAQIAPTLAKILGIDMPKHCVEKPLSTALAP